jgi:small-conductance mechanosensitive channel
MRFAQPLVEQITAMWVSFVQTLPNLALAAVALLFTWLLLLALQRALGSILGRSRLRPSLVAFIQTLLTVLVWLLGILIATTIVFPSVTPGRLLATVGLGSVALGFAFKDVFENFLAGILIMLRKPMRLGDFIECAEVRGTIEQITIRDTYLRQTDGVLVIVPNGYVFKNPVTITTDRRSRRLEILCGVSYDSDLEQARRVLEAAVRSVDLVDREREIEVFAHEFSASSIDFIIRWWSGSDPRSGYQSRDQVIRAVKQGLEDAGIDIPFPQRTLSFAQPLSVDRLSGS